MALTPINQLAAEWEHRRRGPLARAVLTRLVAAEPAIAELSPIEFGSITASLESTSPATIESRRAVLAALIRQFELDELVGLALVVALRPGLLSIGRRLDWGAGTWESPDAFAVDLVSTLWTVLHRVARTTVAYPERAVLRCVRRRLEYAATRRRVVASCELADPAERDEYGHLSPLAALVDDHPISVLEDLGRALAGLEAGTLSRGDARFLFAHRVMGYSLAELASASGEKLEALKHRRRSLETRLAAEENSPVVAVPA